MKKSILSIGKILDRTEQKSISGGAFGVCENPQNVEFASQSECWAAGMPYCYPLNNDCWGSPFQQPMQ